MSREYEIPGGPGIQETGTREYQIPGGPGIQETAGGNPVTTALSGSAVTSARGTQAPGTSVAL